MEELLSQFMTALCAGGAIAMVVLFFIAVLRNCLWVARPNEILIFSGRGRRQPLIGGGWEFVIPLIERVDRMEVTNLPIDIRVNNAYSKGGIPLSVHAVANVKISSSNKDVKNAIERFLGRDINEVRRVAKESLEGHLRGALATLTPEEVNEDRSKTADALLNEATEDFEKLGLTLDTLKIQNVSDDVKYLDSIGRSRIAEVIRKAEIAESESLADAQEREAAARQAGEVAVQQAQTTIIEAENHLRRRKAELEAEARSEEEEALAAAAQARATAERQLQETRRELAKIQLEVEVTLPAEARRKAAALNAQGEAASILENGKALAAVLDMMSQTWRSAGPDAKEIFLIQQLEEVLETVVERVQKLDIEEVVLLDDGSGSALPRHVASFPAMVGQVLGELSSSTGIDVAGILTGTAPAALPSHPADRS